MKKSLPYQRTEDTARRWAVVLAGGDGRRLLSLTRQIAGDDRPKQFCKLVGDETLLNQTRRRASRIISPENTLIVLNQSHEDYFASDLTGLPSSALVLQPCNQGTAAAILYALLRIRDSSLHAVVTFFPSDHHFAAEDALLEQMQFAFSAVETRPEKVVLMGIQPDHPEASYGWIEPGSSLPNLPPERVRQVSRFYEKPSAHDALELMQKGCLWNSFIMVGRVAAFLHLFRNSVPDTVHALESIRRTFHTSSEALAARRIYATLSPDCFSSVVLVPNPSNLLVVRAAGLGWSDLGEPDRVLAVRQQPTSPPESATAREPL